MCIRDREQITPFFSYCHGLIDEAVGDKEHGKFLISRENNDLKHVWNTTKNIIPELQLDQDLVTLHWENLENDFVDCVEYAPLW